LLTVKNEPIDTLTLPSHLLHQSAPNGAGEGTMKHVFAAIVLLIAFHTHAAGWEDKPQVSALFNTAGVTGAFVLYDVTAQTYSGHNEARARTRFVPASTFKIPNSLIGLSVGAVASVDDVLPYTGPPHPFIEAWAKEMGLREAITLSNVPIYQELARRIGLDRMRAHVARLQYGNTEIGDTVDNFWLVGPLQISAIEQTHFLAKLAQGTLPLPQECQQRVREIVLLDQGTNWQLYGKTGWQNAPGPGVGWWVGWVQKEERIYAFALNIEMQQASDASKRIELGRASLKALGIL
jgi:beta-lactamase class D